MKNRIMSLAVFALIVPNVILGANKGWLSWAGSLLHLEQKSVSERTLEGKNPISKENYDPELVAWIEKLGKHENCPILGKIDANKKLSYGKLCFQEQTFIRFVEEFDMLPYTERYEYMNFIGDEKIQKELAYKMIKSNFSNWKHWLNTTRKIGLPPK